MKKYVKPDVYYENFELTQSISVTTCQIVLDKDGKLKYYDERLDIDDILAVGGFGTGCANPSEAEGYYGGDLTFGS